MDYVNVTSMLSEVGTYSSEIGKKYLGWPLWAPNFTLCIHHKWAQPAWSSWSPICIMVCRHCPHIEHQLHKMDPKDPATKFWKRWNIGLGKWSWFENYYSNTSSCFRLCDWIEGFQGALNSFTQFCWHKNFRLIKVSSNILHQCMNLFFRFLETIKPSLLDPWTREDKNIVSCPVIDGNRMNGLYIWFVLTTSMLHYFSTPTMLLTDPRRRCNVSLV
jgi:hypothetical protein